MKEELDIRIKVLCPLTGVSMMLQRGTHELVPPKVTETGDLVFRFPVNVDLSMGSPNFLGKNVHGPKSGRFIYINSGARAGEARSAWDRRAKVSLMGIDRELIAKAVSSGGVLATEFDGVGKDGGPACASIHGITWKLENK